jgi:hypothetical protein
MIWWKYAKAGDKLVCVDDRWKNKPDLCPKLGDVLTLKLVEELETRCGGKHFFAMFEECGRALTVLYFRPVQTRSTETGMSILKSLLTGAGVKEGMDA